MHSRGRTFLSVAVVVLGAATLATGAARADWHPEPYNGGVPVCVEPGGQTYPAVVGDGAGGTYVAWVGGNVYIQHLDRDGAPQWALNGIPGSTGGHASKVVLVADGSGGVIVLWMDTRVSSSKTVYAQRVDASGTLQWAAGGVALTSVGNGIQNYGLWTLKAVADGAGGAVLCFTQTTIDRFGNESLRTVRAQRVDASGVKQWGTNGVALSTYADGQDGAELTTDGAGGAIVVWYENRFSSFHVYAQRLDSSGTALWTANGVSCAASSPTATPTIASDGNGGAIIAFVWNSTDVGAQHLNASGTLLWNYYAGTWVCNATGDQTLPVVVSDGAGGAVFAWLDTRNGTAQVYAQRMDGSANPLFTANGIPITNAPNLRNTLVMAPDETGGAFLGWVDYRSGLEADVYGCHLDNTGGTQPLNGAPVCAAVNQQNAEAIAADGRGGAVLVWHDYRTSDFDIYAQRLDALGYLGDPAPRILSVTDIPGDQGGEVKVSWTASYLDDGTVGGGFAYRVLQETSPGSWSQVAEQTYGPLAEYSRVVSTAADSGAVNPYSVFRIEAAEPFQFGAPTWTSPPDSGYSVDNLAPLIPSALQGSYADGTTRLEWTANREADLVGYRVYRGDSPDFPDDAGHRVAEPVTPGYTDAAGTAYAYRVTAVDRNGNESPAATWMPEGFPAGQVATRALLELPRPNPARSGATLIFRLPAEGRASVAVCDVSGRLVREVASDRFGAGEHRVQWDLRDASGTPVAPGVYFVRLRAGAGEPLTRSLTVVR